LDWYHFSLAFLGALIYQSPSKKLKVIGVTGTKGKSTTVEMIAGILKEDGSKVASLSSIKFNLNGKEKKNILRMTMPGRFKIQQFLRQAVNEGCKYLVLEVSSQGIEQHRHRFIDFEIAVITNLAPEHIEAHGGFENYKRAKGKLFQAVKGIHILNLDDKNIEYFLKFPAEKKYGYSLRTSNSQLIQDPKYKILATNQKINEKGVVFNINNTEFQLNLLGAFNIYNALASICVGLSQGIDLETCKKGLEKVKGVPGRMETVISEDFKVIVDYAVTPDSLENAYLAVKENFNPKEMICVLGACGGGRDKWKRPILGEIAKNHCNRIILTNEDPYDEDPMEIINQIARSAGSGVKKILDRREAIKESLKIANTGDVVIITGKGSESCMCMAGGKKIPWDDRDVAREEFQKLNTKN